jgi:hypothetical protein
MLWQEVLLGHITQFILNFIRTIVYPSINPDKLSVSIQGTEQYLEQGRFSASVSAKYANDIPGLAFQINISQDLSVVV